MNKIDVMSLKEKLPQAFMNWMEVILETYQQKFGQIWIIQSEIDESLISYMSWHSSKICDVTTVQMLDRRENVSFLFFYT